MTEDLTNQLSRARNEILSLRRNIENMQYLNKNVDLSMDGATAPVTYAISGQVAGGEGAILLEGETRLSADGTLTPAAITTDTRLEIETLDLEPLTTWDMFVISSTW